MIPHTGTLRRNISLQSESDTEKQFSLSTAYRRLAFEQ